MNLARVSKIQVANNEEADQTVQSVLLLCCKHIDNFFMTWLILYAKYSDNETFCTDQSKLDVVFKKVYIGEDVGVGYIIKGILRIVQNCTVSYKNCILLMDMCVGDCFLSKGENSIYRKEFTLLKGTMITLAIMI